MKPTKLNCTQNGIKRMKKNIDHIIQRVSEITGVPKEMILSKTRKSEVVRCRAAIVELCGDDFGVKEIGRSLNMDHSSVSSYRRWNMSDKYGIRELLQTLESKIHMVSDCINFTYPGSYNYVITK